jgi:predicted flap endonuclease-1-like 5' DNA nuclease
MPEISAMHIAVGAAMTAVGAIVGWVMRGQRSQGEKDAVSAGWQDQLNAQRVEHSRLTDQSKDLMEQVSQYQASNMDAKNRSKELSLALKEALAKRDTLQREIKDIRGNLETSMNEREQLQSDISVTDEHVADTQRKNARIAKLQLELEKWQNRLPPLIEKFRQRNDAANRLESELAEAHDRIAEFEQAFDPSETRVEPVRDPDSLTNGRDASNETIEAVEAIDENPEAQEATNGSRDKLQDIKGVGPSIEKTLNEMGIYRFQQIAEMSEYDIDRVANRLKGFRSRIYREDWIGQARELRDQKDSG